jgi:hypothetical protein
VLAPFHEIGHVVFGWITLNPTVIIKWNMVSASRDSIFMSMGGYIGEFAAVIALAEILDRKAWKAWPWCVTPLFVMSWRSIAWQEDVTGFGDRNMAYLIWYLCGALAAVILVWRRYAAHLARTGKVEKEKNKLSSFLGKIGDSWSDADKNRGSRKAK